MGNNEFGSPDIPPLSSSQLTATYTASSGRELVQSGKVVTYWSDPGTGEPIDKPGATIESALAPTSTAKP